MIIFLSKGLKVLKSITSALILNFESNFAACKVSNEPYEKDIKGRKFSKRFAKSGWGSLLGYKPQAQPSLLTKDDDKALGRSLFGTPYIKGK